MVMSRRRRTSSGPPSVVAVSTTRAAGSGTNSPSVVTGAVSSVTHASTSTLRWVGPDDCTDTLPVSPSGTRARLDVVQPGAGSVTTGASGGGFARRPRRHRARHGRPSLAVSWTQHGGGARRPGTPVSPASGRSTAPVPIVVSSTRLGATVVKRPSAAPASLGRNQPSVDRATSASTVDESATTPAGPTGTITKPEPLSPGPATSTVAAADGGPAGGRHRDLAGAGGAGDGDAERRRR